MSRVPLDFGLVPGLAEKLVGPLAEALRALGSGLPRPLQEPEDAELAAIWEAELKTGFQEDARLLVGSLADPAFGQPGYSLEEPQVESLLRACSGLRLTLRESLLGDVPDAALEGGPAQLPPLGGERREGYFAFWFLGGLQELLVQALDGEADEAGKSD